MPELTQFERGKSIMRYLPPKGTAGFATSLVKTPRRVHCPPDKSIATHSFLFLFVIIPPFENPKGCLFYFPLLAGLFAVVFFVVFVVFFAFLGFSSTTTFFSSFTLLL